MNTLLEIITIIGVMVWAWKLYFFLHYATEALKKYANKP